MQAVQKIDLRRSENVLGDAYGWCSYFFLLHLFTIPTLPDG